MTNQQHELNTLIAFEMGKRSEEYNPAVITDTLSLLHQMYTTRDLSLMITDEHHEFVGIGEAINIILTDTYSTITNS